MTPEFKEAIANYIYIVKQKFTSDSIVKGKNKSYLTNHNFIASTYAKQAFTETEIEYFYKAYDRLWEKGEYVEAYCLMRAVFGIFSKTTINELERAGHLFSFKSLLKAADEQQNT